MNKLNDVSDKFSKMLVSKNTIEDQSTKSSFPTEKPNPKPKNAEVVKILLILIILHINKSKFTRRKG